MMGPTAAGGGGRVVAWAVAVGEDRVVAKAARVEGVSVAPVAEMWVGLVAHVAVEGSRSPTQSICTGMNR